ncbi:MAG: TspO/MBR family protein [Planctomycetaceae bacterium]
MSWYNSLIKPDWTPLPPTIGMIWQLLYPVIFLSFGYVFLQAYRRKIPPMVVVPFITNLIGNLSFTPIQFGLRNLPLASIDILVVWASIIWCISAIWRHSKWVALAQIPYLVWVSIATYIQIFMTLMNWGK